MSDHYYVDNDGGGDLTLWRGDTALIRRSDLPHEHRAELWARLLEGALTHPSGESAEDRAADIMAAVTDEIVEGLYRSDLSRGRIDLPTGSILVTTVGSVGRHLARGDVRERLTDVIAARLRDHEGGES